MAGDSKQALNDIDFVGSVTHSLFTGNRFTGNGTAVLWEGTPMEIDISFEQSVFSRNGTDIDNRSGQTFALSEAVFQ